jgi:hypothetical protein
MLVGELSIEQLRHTPETEWFVDGYESYEFDDRASHDRLREVDARGLEVLAFVGTWCPDCVENLPGFVRVLHDLGSSGKGFAHSQLKLYGLDRQKTLGENAFKGGDALIARWGVTRLPTFIFLRDGEEIGRIIEQPRRSLLADTLEIVLR